MTEYYNNTTNKDSMFNEMKIGDFGYNKNIKWVGDPESVDYIAKSYTKFHKKTNSIETTLGTIIIKHAGN
jgi:hypothetical protein